MTSCIDWERRIVAGDSLISNPPLYPVEASAALEYFKELTVVDVIGQPRMGDCCRPWVFDFVSSIFGAWNPETNVREIVEFFLLISKKNTKSTTAAAIMLTALLLNSRFSAEFLILAPTIEVANNSFYPARDAIKVDEQLDALLHVQPHLRMITHRGTGATLKIIAADNETVSGKKATGVLIDELWLFGKRNNAENMLREATGGLASRPEGFVIYLTTQSDEPPSGVFRSKLEYARGVRDGRINDPKFLPVLYEFPRYMLDTEMYLNPENFYITNPNLGTSVDNDFLVREFNKAKEAGKDSMSGFLAKHLNVEITTLLREQSWAGAEFWDAPVRHGLTLDYLLDRCEVVVVGIDGGGLDDLLGLAVLGRESDTLDWLLWTHAWAHPIALQRRKKEADRYRDFARDGHLTIVDRIGQDLQDVGDIIVKCDQSGLLDQIGVDPSGIGDIVDEITGRDIDSGRIIGVSQGWRLNGAIKTSERKLAEGTMWHSGQPMMSWCAGNARLEPKGNAVLITKQASGFGKIDPLMAMLNTVSLMAMNPVGRKKSEFKMFFV